jgi:hypothetical protein
MAYLERGVNLVLTKVIIDSVSGRPASRYFPLVYSSARNYRFDENYGVILHIGIFG